MLLLLKREAGRCWFRAELVDALRGSISVVDSSIDALSAGGLIVAGDDGSFRYGPAGASLATLVDQSEALYAQRSDAVRRTISKSRNTSLNAFADAFRLRRD